MAEASNRPLRVFLNYASDDKPIVRELYKRLVADGIDAWLDVEKLLPGQNWRVEISKAIRNSDAVIICLSKASVLKEGYIQKEIKSALDIAEEKPEGTIFIIPLKLDECEVPERLQDWQWVNLFEEAGYQKMLAALQLRAKTLGEKVEETNKSKNAESLFREAQRLELLGKIESALEKYYEVRRQDSLYPRIEVIIGEIEAELASEKQRKKDLAQEKPWLRPIQEYFGKYSSHKWNPTIVAALITAAATIIAAFLGFEPLVSLFKPTPTPVSTSTVTPTLTITATFTPLPFPTPTPTLTFTPSLTSTPTITPTPTPLPTRIVDQKGIAMALVPAGEFTMGNDKGLSPEKPEHLVFLSAYYIDVYEVTNASYAACVAAGACQKPVSGRSRTISNYYTDADFANFPVVYVTWEMAQAYCGWRGGRLPTEAEWEKAARGTDQRLFPTGAGVSCTLANYCREDTTEVGRYREPPGPYGLFDMAGNVAEWVADWYSAGYYSASLPENPAGPAMGQLRVVRGGSFESVANTELQTSSRAAQKPEAALDYVGFRCVREP